MGALHSEGPGRIGPPPARRSRQVNATDPQLAHAPAPHGDAAKGVFETLLVAGGRAREIPRHLARLATSMHELYGTALPHTLHERIAAAAAEHRLARLRVDAGPHGGEGEIATAELDPALVLAERECEVVTVAVAGGFGAHKLADRAWLEEIEAAAGDGVRPLLVAPGGALLETTRANIFLLRGGVIATPPLDGSILPGVTRAVLLERAHRLRIPAHELPLTLADLRDADAVLLTSSLRLLEVAHVRAGAAETIARLRAELAP